MSIEEDTIEQIEKGIQEVIQEAKSKIYKLQAEEYASKRQRKPLETQSTGKYILVYKGKVKLIKPKQNGLLETVKEYLQDTENTVSIDYKILDSKRNLIFKNVR